MNKNLIVPNYFPIDKGLYFGSTTLPDKASEMFAFTQAVWGMQFAFKTILVKHFFKFGNKAVYLR